MSLLLFGDLGSVVFDSFTFFDLGDLVGVLALGDLGVLGDLLVLLLDDGVVGGVVVVENFVFGVFGVLGVEGGVLLGVLVLEVFAGDFVGVLAFLVGVLLLGGVAGGVDLGDFKGVVGCK